MSADNWTDCPKCKAIAELEIDQMIMRANRKYGIVDSNEYLNMIELAREKRTTINTNNNTLREDYEIGIWDGEFNVSYSANCAKCGFKFEYDYQEPINIGAKRA